VLYNNDSFTQIYKNEGAARRSREHRELLEKVVNIYNFRKKVERVMYFIGFRTVYKL